MGGQVNSFLQELRVKPLHDFHCLETFCSGVESMDIFIRNDFRMSVENHYCAAYVVTYQDEVVAVFALSFDSLDLDSDDKEELEVGISSTGTPDVDWNYKDTFYSKPRYPALDIAYLAVQEKWRGQGVRHLLVDTIAEQARYMGTGTLCTLRISRLIDLDNNISEDVDPIPRLQPRHRARLHSAAMRQPLSARQR